jgi:hypothetical protein
MILVLSKNHVWMLGLVGQCHILISTLSEVFHFLGVWFVGDGIPTPTISLNISRPNSLV